MILAIAATLAIVVQDHAPLRAAPRADAPALTTVVQGELVEIRAEGGGYLKVYDYHRERGGYLRSEAAHVVSLTPADAPQLLAVLRFLADTRGSEALGISYGAAYLKAAPASALTAEPLDDIARMAERLADQASASGPHVAEAMARLEVLTQFGIHTRSFEHDGRQRTCYDGQMYQAVLGLPGAAAELRARAALGLTRDDCIDPELTPLLRAAVDADHGTQLEGIPDAQLTPMTRSRLNLRRATVWAAVAYEQARQGRPCAAAAQRALSALRAVRTDDLGDDRHAEYLGAVVRVGAVRWAAAPPAALGGSLVLNATPGEPGQTCVSLARREASELPLVRRCTYGMVWTASAQELGKGQALVLAVQPLVSWRELWVFRETGGTWTVEVLSPGYEDPQEGYFEFAGFSPETQRLLTVREALQRGSFERRFEEYRLDDLARVRQASAPELLMDFGRWQDARWHRETLALH